MLLRAFVASCVLVLGGSLLGLAQQPTGPATLEDLLTEERAAPAKRPVAVDATDPAAAIPLPNGRIQGAVTRPKDGVQHPDLDKAWAEYDAVVAKAAEGIKAAITKQFDAATAKGDLNAAEKWQAALGKFEKAGEVPSGTETKAALIAAEASCEKAKDELADAYDELVKSLTMDKKIAEARSLRSEQSTVWLPRVAVNGIVYLSDVRPVNLLVPTEGKPFQQGTMLVDGVQREHGLLLHPPTNGLSTATFEVPRGCRIFSGGVAMNDTATRQKTALVFKVVDDRKFV